MGALRFFIIATFLVFPLFSSNAVSVKPKKTSALDESISEAAPRNQDLPIFDGPTSDDSLDQNFEEEVALSQQGKMSWPSATPGPGDLDETARWDGEQTDRFDNSSSSDDFSDD